MAKTFLTEYEEEEQRAVIDAACFFDDRFPRWARRVNLERLDMSSCENCVLGQIFGSYLVGDNILNIAGYVPEAGIYPFVPGLSGVIQQTWVEEIRHRQLFG